MKLHPSGMTQERWDWPFKTPEERKLVVKYYQRAKKEDKKKQLDKLGPAPF
jgi:hypothetical protein